MSDSPQDKLTELIETLAAATPLVTHLHEDDPLRRKLYDTLLTAQLRDPARRRALHHWMTQPDNPPGVQLGDPARLDRLRLVPKVDALQPATPDDTTAQCFTCNAKFPHPAEAARLSWLRAHERLHDMQTVPANIMDPEHTARFAERIEEARAQALAAADREGLQSCGCVIVKGNAASICERHRAPSPLQCVHAWHAIVRDGNTPPDDACPGRCGATVQTSTIATPVDASSRVCDCDDDDCGGDCARSRPTAGDTHKGDYVVTDTPQPTCWKPGDTEHDHAECLDVVEERRRPEHPGKGAAVDITAPVPAGIGCTDCGAQLGTNTRCQTCLQMAPPMPAVQFGKATLN